MAMCELGLEKNDGFITKISRTINRFRVSLVEFKNGTKKLYRINLEGNEFSDRKESVNDWLRLEHSRNLALIERQRQRST